ncbi:MAG: hypothetical protein HY273_05135 [Gammaproteobacteria bacterium]|nr:hypothetical protein [Gammaproteobacteria bacterium]
MQPTYNTRATLVLSSIALLQFALFIGYFPFAIIVTPYGDVLDWLNGYYTLADQNLWQTLWAPHNGHRLVFSKLLSIGDATLFGGLSYPIAAVCMVLLLIAAATALLGIHRSVENHAQRRWATAVAALLLFPTSTYASFAYPVNSQHLLVCIFVFLACVLLARCAAAVRPSERIFYLLLALAAGLCASLTALNGLIVWPLLMWMGWALRLGRAYGLAITLVGVLAIAGFSYDYPIASETASVASGLQALAHIANYLIEYHGMPWIEVGGLHWPAMVLGLAILLLSIVFSLKGLLTARTQQPIAIVATAMLTFSLATAVMIAIGRHQLELLPAHRYAIFLLIAFVALFVLNMPRFERWMSSARGRSIVVPATLVFALGYLAQQVAVGQFAAQRAMKFAQYEKDFLAGGRDPQMTTALYLTGVDTLEQRYRMLEQQRIYMFRPR